MKYGIYFAYWEKEWDADQIKYIHKVKQLGFDGLEISCAMLREISDEQLLKIKKMADYENVQLTAGYGPRPQENLASPDPQVQKNAIIFFTDILKKLEIKERSCSIVNKHCIFVRDILNIFLLGNPAKYLFHTAQYRRLPVYSGHRKALDLLYIKPH